MITAESILNKFKKFDTPLVLKDKGMTFNRYHFKDQMNLTIDYLQKNDLGTELLSIKLIDKNIQHLIDTKEKLENFSNQLCNQITFLSENIRLIEIDKKNNKAQIRSYPPFIKLNEKLFFEIIINANEPSIYICRKATDNNRLTRPVSFVLSDEILQRVLYYLIRQDDKN